MSDLLPLPPPAARRAARAARVPSSAAVAALLVIAVTASPTTSGGASAATGPTVERVIVEEVRRTAVPGAAWAVLDGDRVVTGATGRTGPTGYPVTERTPFVIGSLSKSMTALATLRAVDSGRLSLGPRWPGTCRGSRIRT